MALQLRVRGQVGQARFGSLQIDRDLVELDGQQLALAHPLAGELQGLARQRDLGFGERSLGLKRRECPVGLGHLAADGQACRGDVGTGGLGLGALGRRALGEAVPEVELVADADGCAIAAAPTGGRGHGHGHAADVDVARAALRLHRAAGVGRHAGRRRPAQRALLDEQLRLLPALCGKGDVTVGRQRAGLQGGELWVEQAGPVGRGIARTLGPGGRQGQVSRGRCRGRAVGAAGDAQGGQCAGQRCQKRLHRCSTPAPGRPRG